MIDESPVPVVYRRRITDLEHFVDEQDLRIVFYVNQNQKNFQMFRYGRMWHVFINHGESDKMYMTTNQFKAYDYALVAGEAALDRLGRKLWDFDLAKKAIPIGRPQADHFAAELPAGGLPYQPDERTVVLYAPTWEGDRPAAAYGSIASHGVALAEAVLASPAHRLIYRPHPRSGVIDTEYRAANERIIASIAAANRRDPRAQHVFDDGPDARLAALRGRRRRHRHLGDDLRPARDGQADHRGAARRARTPRSTKRDSSGSAAVAVRRQGGRHPDPRRRRCSTTTRRAQRSTTGRSGISATRRRAPRPKRFHDAVDRLLAEWDRHAKIHIADQHSSESDPLDDEDDEEGLPASDD